ncbi:hypothetical protein A3B42_01080 [Candidatus Daviesbacteria bacterium RIFCSPLOWO2_01_FULL_38_10]|uniref:Uncharacterized protein n=1 Tax=Candidatus Daviesbacteria bacterium GW2011_GWF2_38_6 TaxID=1618432 RepID=A0A0G0MRE0_9BACT|nr:MAG: hypothetical protein US99_C0080G0007 [Candidatus Daviesbacteria bacterium GW2011_GWF2_38_6]OGE37116.1 MAG: hypothetical protein A3B42_01080 [Candidatus Daviesbacteria bacterium RIFCSPLOWO2_01_FULL_38_10]OGE68211.1 MAG: hypothetical protein A3H81_02810 [Candidatus Daviesbacteria bacterium RIFCSPLOWO2_02_FULL_38_18]OGE73470.1 MAG: hypothetical protein A3H18_01165 [Candidatus Daviesbacteria bacterium RIFCSPLOWO2_12_FULL_38_10]HBQ50885.1 hypothetical protein [Candidatus Daviesbacteria bacte
MRRLETETDRTIWQHREAYFQRLLPFARAVITEDGYYQDALRDLSSEQRDVVTAVFADYATVKQFGRLTSERSYTINHGSGQTMDPLRNRYSRRLHEVGIKDSAEWLAMLPKVGDVINSAAFGDPFFDRPQV